jgi:hypothetical protein
MTKNQFWSVLIVVVIYAVLDLLRSRKSESGADRDGKPEE